PVRRLARQLEQRVGIRQVAEVLAIADRGVGTDANDFGRHGGNAVFLQYRRRVADDFGVVHGFGHQCDPEVFQFTQRGQGSGGGDTAQEVDTILFAGRRYELRVDQRARQYAGNVAGDLAGNAEQFTEVTLGNLQAVIHVGDRLLVVRILPVE